MTDDTFTVLVESPSGATENFELVAPDFDQAVAKAKVETPDGYYLLGVCQSPHRLIGYDDRWYGALMILAAVPLMNEPMSDMLTSAARAALVAMGYDLPPVIVDNG